MVGSSSEMGGGRSAADGHVLEGTVLWEPSADRVARAQIGAFMRWLSAEKGIALAQYDDLWRWSVEHLEEFWSSVASYFGVIEDAEPSAVLRRGTGAEGASWFPGAELNYLDRLLRNDPDAPALVAVAEDGEPRRLSYRQLFDQAGAAAAGLRRLGVGPGDRVAAVLGNGVEAVVGFLAAASLGAVWSSCAPEFGAVSMVDRFRQIEPKVLLCTRGYRYGGRHYDLEEKIGALLDALPGLGATVVVEPPDVPADEVPPTGSTRRVSWDWLCSDPAPLDPIRVAFSHPLWILYSSGTTGLPKPIVQGHGGIVLEHLKALSLHCDIGPGDRFFWFTTTGWMMWNFLVGGLLVGATIVCYDGDPMWPDNAGLWRLAETEGVTYFGTSAPFLESCRRADLAPRTAFDLRVRSIGSTGAPLSPDGFAWAARAVGDDVLVGSVSGGTDLCTAFLASCPLLPVRAGELQCRALGADVAAVGDDGQPVVGEVGELVLRSPMPSMPVALWGDDDGSRLHDSYFATFPGMWRHGDWVKITPDGGAVVYGRSDATLNRGGVRMGTAEFYRVVESLPEVADALVVDTSELGRAGRLVLLVVPRATADRGSPGAGLDAPTLDAPTLDAPAEQRIRQAIRQQLSPRHVPDVVVAVDGIPRTLNGKKVEVPIRRILLGAPVDTAVSTDALADPELLGHVISALRDAGVL